MLEDKCCRTNVVGKMLQKIFCRTNSRDVKTQKNHNQYVVVGLTQKRNNQCMFNIFFQATSFHSLSQQN